MTGEDADTPREGPAKKSSLGIRIASALVLIPLVIGFIWYGGWPFMLLIAAAALILVSEWRRLVFGKTGGGVEQAMLSLAVIIAALSTQSGDILLGLLAAAGLMLIAMAVSLWRRTPLTRIALGFPYIVLPTMILIWLRADPVWGIPALFWLFVSIWATDSFAYFAGKSIGGPKLAPVLSPNKTWAGLIGGSLGAAATGAVIAAYLGTAPIFLLAGLSASLAIISQAGDITESGMKRRAGVKDSGQIIPGHGGLLDRVDGLLFASMAAAVIALLHHGGFESPGAALLVWY